MASTKIPGFLFPSQVQGKEAPKSSKTPPKQKASSGTTSGAGQKRGRPSSTQQAGSKEGKGSHKPPKPGVKSPVAKAPKTAGVKKIKETGQTQAASHKSSGIAFTASTIATVHDNAPSLV